MLPRFCTVILFPAYNFSECIHSLRFWLSELLNPYFGLSNYHVITIICLTPYILLQELLIIVWDMSGILDIIQIVGFAQSVFDHVYQFFFNSVSSYIFSEH